MYEGKELDKIHSEILTEVSNEYDKTVGSFIYDVTKPVAIQFEGVYKELINLHDKLSIKNLSGDELTQRVNEQTGIIRKPSTKATTEVTVYGLEGATINVDDKVASETVTYSVQETKTIDSSGKALVLVKCDQFGSIGNVPVNSIKYFTVTLEGLTSITNESVVTNGYNAETDSELKQRYYERIRTPATSGNKYHYLNWAKSISGIGDARVFPLWNGDNTVKVVVINSDREPASSELVSEVQNYIDPGITGLGDGFAPIGASCTVESAEGVNIDISFSGALEDGYTVEDVTASLSQKLTDYLKDIAFKQDYISYAQVGSIIINTLGISDYTNLTINNGSTNLSILDNQVAVLGVVNLV
jgi:uncharacterized phage protein gp47/JayE